MRKIDSVRGALRLRVRPTLGAFVLVVTASACSTDTLLKVNDPELAPAASATDSANVQALINGAVSDFQVGYGGAGGDSYLSVSSLISDELRDSDTFTTRIATDQRLQFPAASGNTSDGAYENLHRARLSARLSAESLTRTNAKDTRIPLVRTLEGYTYVALAESFCSQLPFSTVTDILTGAREYGVALTTAQTFDEALKRFDQALAVTPTYNFAKIGRARALLDNGKFAEAEQAVAGIPTTFMQFVEFDANTTRQQNPLFSLIASNRRYTVADKEGTNGLAYRAEIDPRVPWRDQGRNGFDGQTRLFENRKYSSFNSDLVIADGVEARLIEAEARLRAGDVATWLTKLNELRADVLNIMRARVESYDTQLAANPALLTTLPPLTDPGNLDARVNLMFHERAFWMYTTGHRLGDMRRLIRQYGRAAEQVFPTGSYHKGGTYGKDLVFPVPFNEEANPNFRRDQCKVDQA